jgi:hypothetical protein
MKEITVEHLISEANSEHTYFTEFALAYNGETNNLYCFYEGYDDTKYFSVRVKNITKKKIGSWFYCAGKDNVVNACNLIKQHSEYDLNNIVFFIDKDFSNNSEIDNNIYITPYYSVENFYTTKEVLEAIVTDEFKVIKNSKENNDYEHIFEIYEKLVSDFHNKTTFLNAWLACQNDKREKLNEKRRLHIDDKVKNYFRSIVSNDLQTIQDYSDLNNINKLKEIFPYSYDIEENELNSKIDKFKQIEAAKFFRGKFELQFFVSFLNRIKEELGKRNSLIFSKKYKIDLRLEFSSAISSLSQYAETPECLIEYLEKYKNAA